MNPPANLSHPAPEQWAEYLYDETTPETRARLEAHLRDCPDCRQRLVHWRATQTALDAWKAPARVRPHARMGESVRWAVAALLLLGLGWLGGRLAAPADPDLDQLRAAVVSEIRPELERAFQSRLEAALQDAEQRQAERLQALAAAWAAARAEDQQTTLTLYQRAERQRLSDYATLRRDLETVAIVARDAIGATRHQLAQLAVHTPGPTSGGGGEEDR